MEKTFSTLDDKSATPFKTERAGAGTSQADRNRPRPPRGAFMSAGAAGAMTFCDRNEDARAEAS